MSMKRIVAVFLRYFYFFGRMENMSELFYWPTIDIFLWGMTGAWIAANQSQIPDVALTILTGLVFWLIIWRGHYEITMNLLQEFWNRNLVNLFSTPLKLSEWMVATMLVGLYKIGITIGFSSLLIFLLYKINVFVVGWAFLPYIVLLMCSGWAMGYLTAGLIVYFGQRLQMLGWMTPFIFAPFSAMFYPLSILPTWAQYIAKCLPTTYIFEGMREILLDGVFSYTKLWMSVSLNAIFLTVTCVFFKVMYEKSRAKGLARLE